MKSTKIDKPLARVTKRERRRKSTKIEMKKEISIQVFLKITRDYFENIYSNKLGNLRYSQISRNILPTQSEPREYRKPKQPISCNETEAIIINFLTMKSLQQDSLFKLFHE